MTPPPETVQSEEIRALFEQVRPVLWANVAVAAIVCATLWSEAPQQLLLGWFVAIALLTWVRVMFHASYARERPHAGEIESWGRRFVVASTASGLLWGAAGALFFNSGSLLSQGLLAFALAGMTAAAAGTLASHLPAFFGYFIPALFPLMLRTLAEGDDVHLGMAAMVAAYGLGMQRVARNNHAAFVRAFSLALENQQLLEQLSLSQIELQETNHTLEQRVRERTHALEEQADALRQAQRLEVAGRLAGGLAHDFNSLLTVVVNNAAALKEQPGQERAAQQAADEVLEAGQRGVALIRQLLAFSRRKKPEPRAFPLNTVVSEWTHLFARILGPNVVVEATLSSDAPIAYADPTQLEHVLVNLVASTRSRLPGNGVLRLETRTQRVDSDVELPDGDYVELVVEHATTQALDGPSGLDALASFNVDSRQRSAGITGAFAAAHAWGGRVTLERESERSMSYAVLLPAAPAVERKASLPFSPNALRRTGTILVVDDEPTLRAVIRRALAREGHSVLTAEDGKRALEVAAGHGSAIDLLLTDVVMPGMSGLELARQFRLHRPRLPVLYISGFTFEEEVPGSDAAQLLGYLPKPFETQELANKVSELLEASRAGDATFTGQPLVGSG